MVKQDLLEYLRVQTAFFSFERMDEIFTTENISKKFGLKRNTVSHYLNQAVHEGDIIKINTRPVYFLHKAAFEAQFFLVNKTSFSSIQELASMQPKFNRQTDIFSLIIGHDHSLARSIEQLKTAAIYPKGELPFIITGESGTGKSYMVQVYYQYCLENELIAEDAPFITFNCAQYANNPELLTSNLFGYKKGAFTGANSDQPGAFEAAENGILFLDEVHRLSPVGQEKLFTYLDKKVIFPVGETQKGKKLIVRLAFATTEDLASTFLTTFVRRIPIQISLPNLSARTSIEKKELIYVFFIREATKIDKQIQLSQTVLTLLKNGNYRGNIGELKNTIKYSVARAYARQKQREIISVTIYDLPRTVLLPNDVLLSPVDEESTIVLDKNTEIHTLRERKSNSQQAIIYTYEKLLALYSEEVPPNWIKMEQLVEQLLDTLFFETKSKINQELFHFISHFVREVVIQIEQRQQVKFQGNSIYAISYYLFFRSTIHWRCADQATSDVMEALLKELARLYPDNYQLATVILDIIGNKLDIEVFEMDHIIFTLYFNKLTLARTSNEPRAIIIAHGYSTASSIANVANRMLNRNIFEAFDMPLDTSPIEITDQVISYAQTVDISNGLVILVDMGSLKEIYKALNPVVAGPVAILNNVTTQIALSVGEKLQYACSFEKMMTKIVSENQLIYEIVYPDISKAKVIISTCYTGIGTAKKIMNLLERSIPGDIQLTILAYEFSRLKREIDNLAMLYDIVGIIGTINPELLDYQFVSLEEIISGEGIQKFKRMLGETCDQKQLSQINDQLIKNFSLEKVIDSVTILDTEKVMGKIELFINYYENLTNFKLVNSKKLALYIHVSCLIERLIRNVPIEHYGGEDENMQCQKKHFKMLKQAFSVIEEYYSVEIPEGELGYVYDLIVKDMDNSMIEEDF